MRYWGKIKIEDRIQKDITLEESDFLSALAAVCDAFDLSKPIVCAKHHMEVKAFSRTVFIPDDFVESVEFDTLEIELIGKKKKDSKVITL